MLETLTILTLCYLAHISNEARRKEAEQQKRRKNYRRPV